MHDSTVARNDPRSINPVQLESSRWFEFHEIPKNHHKTSISTPGPQHKQCCKPINRSKGVIRVWKWAPAITGYKASSFEGPLRTRHRPIPMEVNRRLDPNTKLAGIHRIHGMRGLAANHWFPLTAETY